ncbi:MAG: hypothetical protein AAF902_04685 [Chloroflexota bacterium]
MNQGETQNRQQPEDSIFDKQKRRNPEMRRRQLRILKLTGIGIGALFLLGLIAFLSPIGARFVMNVTQAIAGDLEQPTATPTLDLSGIVVASPTPPPTATTLFGGQTYEAEIATADAERRGIVTVDGTPISKGTPQQGAIFVTLEPTLAPTDTPTPLPTREAVNFAQTETGELPTLSARLDPRCAEEPTPQDYIYCVVRLAAEGEINP